YESNAIVEYVEEAYPGRGAPLFPGDVRTRAIIRRFILEVDNYLYKATDTVLDQAFWKKPEERDAQKINEGRKAAIEELTMFSRSMRGEYLAGPLSAADFAFYPLVAFLYRAQKMKLPDLDADAMLTPELRAWKSRIEALPYFDKTIPPHWKAA
ncbi:MAG: glutathione S-transferase family protein, partial [Betaproteobacteria bacterium]